MAACCLGAYSAAIVVMGIVAQKRGYPHAVREIITGSVAGTDDDPTAVWSEKVTGFHTIEMARVHVGQGMGSGGGLAEAAGNILFASGKGRLAYLDAHSRLRPLDLKVPMNLEGLRTDPHRDDPLYLLGTMRVGGLLVVPGAPRRFTLYVSHHAYKPDCMQFKVSSIEIEADGDGVRPAGGAWKEVFVARPNCIRYKDRSWRFVGEQAGGRLVQLDADTLLLSVGDHQFDGFNDAWQAPMDPATDLGKIVRIDLRNHASSIYASGVRNPQGLTVAHDGLVWETEHGPQGGDEVNVITEGANYGWPMVTYGMNYGYPRRNWPFDPIPGAHDGYTQPAYAFVPSVGISNIVEPDATEFPNWRRCLIASSLRANTLFLLRTEGNRVVYAEPISVEGDRVRDIISLANGQLAYLSDEGSLVFIRNADRHKDEQRTFAVAGLNTLAKPLPEELPPAQASPVDRGRHMFMGTCATCHALDGGVGIGPPLNGVVGRHVGSAAGYGYSDALGKHGGVWTRDLLISFLTDPDRQFKGSKMPPAPMSWAEIPNIVSFLETTSPSASHEKVPTQ